MAGWAARKAVRSPRVKRAWALGAGGTGADGDAGLDDAALLHIGHQRDHRHGDDQIAPGAEFEEAGAGAGLMRQAQAADKLHRREVDMPGAAHELVHRHGAAAGQDDGRIQRQQAGDAIGGRASVAEIADHGAAILDLHPADLAGGGLQAGELRRQIGRDDVRPGGEAGQPPMVAAPLDRA